MFLELKDISFSHIKGKAVLNNISFSLNKGKTLAIVGASGCGKSTLLRVISGILPGTNSNSLLGSISVENQTPDQYRQSGKLAFMFQEATLMPHLTVKENIELPLKIKGNIDPKKVADLIKAVGLDEFADYLPKQLSGGMKTRVALARAFVAEPELLLLDEPFSTLDIAWKSKLYLILEKLKEKFKTTIILVTHDVQEAILLSDNILVFGRNGSILRNVSVNTSISALKRVDNIADFISTAAYKNLYAPVQDWIIVDGVRKITGKAEVDAVLQRIQLVAGTELEVWESIEQDFISLREHTNNHEVHELLLVAFEKAKNFFFKYELIWDIINYESITEEAKRTVLRFYLENINDVSTLALKYYKTSSENLLDHLLISRIKNTDYSDKRKWIYLCDLYASSEIQKVQFFLDQVACGKVPELNYPFSKEVALLVKIKIQNEKENTLYIA